MMMMMMMDYEAIRNAGETEIRRLGNLALSTADRSLISKPGYDEAVTETDKKIENEFKQWAVSHFPESRFAGEETGGTTGESGFTWVIDPIDGTKYFAAGVPMWTVTAALLHDGNPVVGIIYQPTTGDMYCASLDGGAYLNGQRISTPAGPRRMLVWDWIPWDTRPEVTETVQELRKSLQGSYGLIASYVNGSLGLVWTAMGAAQAFVDPWRMREKYIDIAAGLIFASEAGMRVERNLLTDSIDSIVVARPNLYQDLSHSIFDSLDGLLTLLNPTR